MDLDSQLQEKYNEVPEPQLTILSEIPYSDEDLKNLPIYNTEQMELNQVQYDAICAEIRLQCEKGFNHPNIGKLLLAAARNLKDPDQLDTNLLPNLESTSKSSLSLPEYKLADEDEFEEASDKKEESKDVDPDASEKDILKTFKAPDFPPDMSEKTKKGKLALLKHEHIMNYREVARAALKSKEQKEKRHHTAESDEYWSFIAAYLLKLILKAPGTVKMGLENLKQRYIGFYPGKTVPDAKINLESLDYAQQRIKSDQKLINTWVLMTAKYEESAEQSKPAAGMIRYLANLQLSYSGMQGYSLFREVLIATKWKPKQAILNLWMEATEPALDTINTILVKHETTRDSEGVISKKSPYFKYARLLNPQYFLYLQPRQCLSLIYLCAKILNHYTSHNDYANPLNIVVLDSMGEAQKEFLDCMAHTILAKTDSDTSRKTKIEIEATELYQKRKAIEKSIEKPSKTKELEEKLQERIKKMEAKSTGGSIRIVG
ncbi:nucleocapsid [Yerba mate virus A]|uniref:Nucleoprotein n=1 Tax=Yerba mate virus A TaxID=2713499 RepID=A0A6G6CID8_9RHAB|nr:nucleocapsid [Yerba mate virus A]QID92305.1 nucleocapsid [Yerba mate virus A]